MQPAAAPTCLSATCSSTHLLERNLQQRRQLRPRVPMLLQHSFYGRLARGSCATRTASGTRAACTAALKLLRNLGGAEGCAGSLQGGRRDCPEASASVIAQRPERIWLCVR